MERVAVHPFRFDDPAALQRSLAGVDVLVNTYWVRFPRNGIDYDDAVENIRILVDAAKDAGVRRVVHVSVSNPSAGSEFPYYRGKAQAEEIVKRSGLEWSIIRPTWLFGGSDILLNNVAWLLRRFPVFGMPGNGKYRVQPIAGEDVGRILSDAALSSETGARDAAGPETFTFEEVVRLTMKAMGKRRLIVHLPPTLALGLSKALDPLVRDVILTRYEVGGLRAELLLSSEPPLGTTRFTRWIETHGSKLGRSYHSELGRHFRGVDPKPFIRA